ncbi:MAG: hypothetical protein Kow0059_15840 [Candidatus Sumerlaeia bacterium]
MRSIRRYLIRTLLLALVAAGLVGGAALYWSLRAVLQANFDRALGAKARTLATLVEVEADGRIEFEFADEAMQEFSRPESPEFFQLWADGGRMLERSRSLGDVALPRLEGSPAAPQFVNLTLPGGRRGRAAGFHFEAEADEHEQHESESEARGSNDGHQGRHDGPTVWLTVAWDRSELDRTLARIGALFLVLGIALPMVVAAIVALVVSRGMRPVMQVAAAANRIQPDSLDQRFDARGLPEELRPIVLSLNQMLDRLQGAMERERRFRRDTAHELRTPLAELRTAAEVAAQWPDDAPLQRRTFAVILEIVHQMEDLVQALLALARSENGTAALRIAPVPLAGLVEDVLAAQSEEIRRKRLNIVRQIDGAVSVETDPALLKAIVRNLTDNAVHYAPAGDRIEVRVEGRPDAALVSVGNSAPGLTQDDLAFLAQPFWQKDDARAQSGRFGLGLALVEAWRRILNIGWQARLLDGRLIMTLAIPASIRDEAQPENPVDRQPAARASE